MSLARRPQLTQRRRRVIYSQQTGVDETAAGASRVAQLRAARRPTAAYGARVHRRLRARWFGLVPVRRRALAALALVVAAVTGMLVVGHWLALTWPALAYRPEIARPLRLDRPDGFGTWLGALLLASSSATALLVYQLRRHRADDYKGHYRLWRPVIVLLLLASLDSVAGLIDWGGALLDATLGRRAALAGGDWVRLLLAVGGVSFGLRMIVEVRRSPTAAVALALTLLALLFPAAVRWRIVTIESPLGWTLLAAAPLIGHSALWVALVAYLRLLYREVRRIDDQEDPWRDRVRQWRTGRAAAAGASPDEASHSSRKPKSAAATLARRRAAADATDADATGADDADAEATEPEAQRRRWLWPFRTRHAAKPKPARAAKRRVAAAENEVAVSASPSKSPDASAAVPTPKREATVDAKPEQSPSKTSAAQSAKAQRATKKAGSPRRRWWPFSLRLRKEKPSDEAVPAEQQATKQEIAPIARLTPDRQRGAATAASSESRQQAAASDVPPTTKRRRWRLGLPGWLRRKSAAADPTDDAHGAAAAEGAVPSKRPISPDRAAVAGRTSQPTPPANSAADRANRQTRHDRDDDDEDDEALDGDSAEMSSLSKAERRRLKRQMKRDGRAA